jgi:FkbM family methyltransferase
MRSLENIIRRIFRFRIISEKKWGHHRRDPSRAKDDLYILQNLSDEAALIFLKNLEESKSQLRQDLFALSQLNGKRDGYFVEFGATDGITLSNTYLLEKVYGWKGVLVEPARVWHGALKNNRAAEIDTRCVWSVSNEKLSFNEASIPELSTITNQIAVDLHKEVRLVRDKYYVDTISLTDLLLRYKAPKKIDYLSIDTEGTEYDILGAFNFRNFSFAVITVEHNYTPSRQKIYRLLTKNGYKRVMEEVSQFDDWYIAIN